MMYLNLQGGKLRKYPGEAHAYAKLSECRLEALARSDFVFTTMLSCFCNEILEDAS